MSRLETPEGTVVETRKDAQFYPPGGRRLFHWNALDLTYFLGCAVWHYFTLPALLLC